MSIDVRKFLIKMPYDEFDLDFDFGGPLTELPPGTTHIVSNTLSAIKWPRTQPTNASDATSEILFSNIGVILSPENTSLRIRIQGGTDGYDYKITIRVVFDDASRLENEFYIRVRQE